MNRTSRTLVLTALWAVSGIAVGCSSLGLSTPTNPLTPEAKNARDAATVPAPIARELAKELHPAYVVEPGDTLLVQPVELDAPVRLPPDQPVFPDGTIDLGKYGRPVVAGKTLPQIETTIRDQIKPHEKEAVAVTVRLIGRVSKVYYVLGEVNAPGAFPITGRETVLDGIIAAGGLGRKASQRNIILDRPSPPDGCRIVFPVCYPQIVQLGDTTTNYQLMPGDRIFVPSQGLLESLLPARCLEKRACAACKGPQIPCGGAGCSATAGCGTHDAPGTLPLPVAPAPLPVKP